MTYLKTFLLLFLNMIIYSKNGNRIIVKVIFEIENVNNDERINEIITNGLINLANLIKENKVRIYNSEDLGVKS